MFATGLSEINCFSFISILNFACFSFYMRYILYGSLLFSSLTQESLVLLIYTGAPRSIHSHWSPLFYSLTQESLVLLIHAGAPLFYSVTRESLVLLIHTEALLFYSVTRESFVISAHTRTPCSIYSDSIPPPFYFLTQDILVLFAHKRVPMDSCAWHWKFCRYRMFLVNLWIFWLDIEFSVTLWKCIGVRNARVWGNLVARCYRVTVTEIPLQPLSRKGSGYQARSGVQSHEGVKTFSLSHACDETRNQLFFFSRPSPTFATLRIQAGSFLTTSLKWAKLSLCFSNV